MKLYLRILIFCVAGFLFSCEEEEDCVGCNLNPKIKLRFEAIGSRLLTDTLIDEVNEKIVDIVDSLNNQLTTEERNILLDQLSILREDSINYNETNQLFLSRKINMNRIEAPGSAAGFEQFQDSIIRDFSIPVDMQHDSSIYYFTYHGLTDTLQLYYQRDIAQTFDGVRMRLSEIGVNEEMSTFDSIRVKCFNTDCSNDLTTVYLYF